MMMVQLHCVSLLSRSFPLKLFVVECSNSARRLKPAFASGN